MKPKYIVFFILFVATLISLLFFYFNHNKNPDLTQRENTITFNTIQEIIENAEINAIKQKINISLGIRYFIIPEILNGTNCNSISYKQFLNNYYNLYDSLPTSFKKDTEITLTSKIIKKINYINVDTYTEIKEVEYTNENNKIIFKTQEAGTYIINAEIENNTLVNIIFDVGIDSSIE